MAAWKYLPDADIVVLVGEMSIVHGCAAGQGGRGRDVPVKTGEGS